MEHETRENGDGRDPVASLIRAAGRRQKPPEDAYRTVLAAAQATLREQVATRRQRRIAWAVAATVVVAILATLTPWNPVSTQRPVLATVARVVGSVEVKGEADWQPMAESGRGLAAGERIRTLAGGRVALALAGGESLRLAASTEVVINDARQFFLEEGTIYLDGKGSVGTGIRIGTAAGTARDIGTQYELFSTDGILRLRVREGRVEIERAGSRLTGDAGEQLDIGVLGDVLRSPIAADDPVWLWAESLAPAPDIDGRPASELLEWVARETGRKLHYVDAAIRQRAESVVLHGNISHLAPLEALDVMLATTDLEYLLVGDRMEVRTRATR